MADAPQVTAEELNAAHEEPTYRVGRLVFRGRLLSIEEWLPFFEQRVALEHVFAEDQAAGRVTGMRPWVEHWIAYLRAVFPRRRFRVWAPDPVEHMRRLRANGLREVYDRFFIHQARALGMSASRPTTSGSGSREPTADGTATGGVA